MSATLKQNFERQRRNLIGISLTIFLFYLGDISLPEIDIFGNKFKVKKPDDIYVLLGAFWIYFLYRYVVYFLDIRAESQFQNMVSEVLPEFLKKHTKKKHKAQINAALADFPQNFEPRLNAQERYSDHAIIKISAFNPESGSYEDTNEIIELGKEDIKAAEFKASIYVTYKSRVLSEYVFPFLIGALPVYAFLFYSVNWTTLIGPVLGN